MDETIVECLYAAVDETNALRPGEPPLEKSTDTALFGSASALDSLGLVNFVVAAEQKIEAAFELPIVLADDRALGREPSPFRTIGSLAEYVQVLLRERE
jgi:acyl carrier protein